MLLPGLDTRAGSLGSSSSCCCRWSLDPASFSGFGGIRSDTEQMFLLIVGS